MESVSPVVSDDGFEYAVCSSSDESQVAINSSSTKNIEKIRNLLDVLGCNESRKAFEKEVFHKFGEFENQSLNTNEDLPGKKLKQVVGLKQKVKSLNMYCRQLNQEKQIHEKKIIRLIRQCESYEPLMAELKRKYELMLKQKSLMRIERDKYRTKLNAFEKPLKNHSAEGMLDACNESKKQDSSNSSWSVNAFESKSVFKFLKNKTEADCPPLSFETVQKEKDFQLKTGTALGITEKDVKMILIGRSDGCLELKELLSLETVASFESAHDSWISSIVFHPMEASHESSFVASSDATGLIKIWDLNHSSLTDPKSYLPAKVVQGSSSLIWELQWSTTGNLLISASINKTMKLFDAMTFQCRNIFKGHEDSVNSCCFHPINDCLVLSASADKTVSCWDARTASCEITFYGNGLAFKSARFSKIEPYLIASVNLSGELSFWDMRKIKNLKTINLSDAKSGGLHSLEFDATSNQVIVGGENGLVCLHETKTQDKTFKKQFLNNHESDVFCALTTRDNSKLVSIDKNLVTIWRT